MRRFTLDPLETRRLLAITLGDTSGNDLIRITSDGTNVLVSINGVESRWTNEPGSIVINAGEGNDTIRLEDATGLPVTINGEAGNDLILVGNGNVRAAHLTTVSVIGGAGTDTLTVDDSLSPTANTAVTFDNPIDTYVSAVAAPGTEIRSDASSTASAVENVTYTGTPLADVVNVAGTNALVTLSVNGANGNDTVTVGNDIDSTVFGAISLDGGPGADRLTFDDSADSFIDTYSFGATGSVGTFRKDSGKAAISYTGFGGVTLQAGLGGRVANNQTFRVTALPDVIGVTIFAGTGDDQLYVGDGVANLDLLKGALTFNGEGGVDDIIYNDKVGTDAATYELGASTFTNTGTGTLAFTGCESFALIGNDAANDIRTTTLPDSLTVTLNGGAGNDTLRVGSGDFDANILGGVSIVGGAGSDTLIIDDSRDDLGNDSYTINTATVADVLSGQFRKTILSSIFWSRAVADRVEAINLLCSPNNDSITVSAITPGIALSIDAGDGDDSIKIASTTDSTTSAATAVTVISGTGRDTLDVNSDGSGADAIVALPSAVEDLADLKVRAGGRVNITGGTNAVLAVRGVMTIGGIVDLANATLITSNANLTAASAAVRAGYAGGLWNGAGSTAAIISSAAAASPIADVLATVVADDLALPILSGIPTASGDVIVRYTLRADANLDRVVDFTDLTALALHYGATGQGWAQGNFSFDVDGTVDFSDLVLLAQNCNQTLLPPAAVKRR